MLQVLTDKSSTQMRAIVWASMIGTTIEWYDFVVYSQAASLVFGPLFFPAYSPTLGTLAAFATFGVAYVARPIGAVVFGHLGDRAGRKSALVATLTLMGVATTAIGLLPTYAQAGIAAPVGLVLLRLLQGFAVGGEWGGAVLMTVEHAPAARRGYFGAWPQLGSSLALILATAIMALLSASLGNQAFASWGWRVPFLLSAVLVVIGLFIRLRLTESPEFLKLQESGRQLKAPIADVWKQAKLRTVLAVGAQTAMNVCYYVVVVFALGYAVSTVGVSRTAALFSVMIAAAAELVALLIFAVLSDKVGRKPILIAGTAFIGLFGYPFFLMVQSDNVLLFAIATVLGLALGHGTVYSTLSTYLAECYGVRSRYTGLSLAYHLGGALSSGPTPLIAGALLLAYGSVVPVALLIFAAAVISIACFCLLPETRGRDLSADTRAG